jgi:hypothetical protein
MFVFSSSVAKGLKRALQGLPEKKKRRETLEVCVLVDIERDHSKIEDLCYWPLKKKKS